MQVINGRDFWIAASNPVAGICEGSDRTQEEQLRDAEVRQDGK